MRRFLKFLFIKLPLAFILLTVLWVVVLKWVPVWVTPLMIKRSIEYREDKDFKTQKKWKSLDEISPELVRAVIASEDNRFGEHDGFDRVEIKRAIDDHKNKGKRLRG
ncbi:MAG: transglycosylase domain-containing protein, partial [Bacteroidales bacterium]|nr:transglycosylase domain-containing protein [Bacteroidales bacterium]